MRKIYCLILFQFFLVSLFEVAAQKPLMPRDSTIKGPQSFAIIVGISKYKYVRPLTYADKDAELFRDFLKSPGGGSMKDDNIFCLLNDQALNSVFWTKGFAWLRAKQLQKGDKLFIYLAGHGDAIDENEFFFLSYDCNPAGDKNNYIVGGAIQLYNLKNKIANETSKGVEVYLIMDACRSNELPGGQEGQNSLNNAISERKAGEIMMLATTAGQESLEDVSIGNGHGLFTWYLVDGLSGLADTDGNPDSRITFSEIRNYVDKNVPSVAQQRFNKKQDPYFCCNENSDKVVTMVDPTYLQKWLKEKKAKNRSGANSFSGTINNPAHSAPVDTNLVETYNRFNRAVKDNNITGSSSAEYYFQQLDIKFPGNPYTLDAKSTLAVEYINNAQSKVNDYLGCFQQASKKQKQDNFEAGLRLEKAIGILMEDDPDFAKSYRGRMYLLKASGDFGSDGTNGDISVAFQNAYAALAIDRNMAYINNKLALLHLENNNLDSAQYYADKAAKIAPKWACALTTLALVKNTIDSKPKPEDKKTVKKNSPVKKNSFGLAVGSGASEIKATRQSNAGPAVDNVTAIDQKNIVKFDLGILYQVSISKNISIRPTTLLSFEGGDLVYHFRRFTNQTDSVETISIENIALNISVPVVIRFSAKNISPFFSIGPTFSYIFKQDATSAEKVPVKKSVILGDAGLGVDIGIPKAHIILSPEIKFSTGFNDIKEDANTAYARALSSLKKQTITFTVYLRAR